MTNSEKTRRVESVGRLMTAEELSEELGVHRRTVWRLNATGKLPPPIRIGRLVRWRLVDIEKWLESGGTRER